VRHSAALTALLGLVACGSQRETSASAQPDQASPTIHFVQYKSPHQGGPEVFMEALIGGKLAVRGGCVGILLGGEAEFAPAVFHSEARLGRDRHGLFVESRGGIFRVGDDVQSGGGSLPSDFSEALLKRPLPIECKRPLMVELSGLERPPRNPPTVPVNPPPPPIATRRKSQ